MITWRCLAACCVRWKSAEPLEIPERAGAGAQHRSARRFEPLDIQPLTLSTAKLRSFLSSIQAKGGGEWQENTLSAVQTAVTRMDWKPYARKVIVLIGDSPPEKDDFAPLAALIRNSGAITER